MSQHDDEGVPQEQAPAAAAHHELTDRLSPDGAPSDAQDGLGRLLGWMGDEAPLDEGRPQLEAGPGPEQPGRARSSGDELELTRLRLMAVDRLAQSRKSNARVAFGAVVLVSVLAVLGLLFRLSSVPGHVALPVLLTVGAIDGVLILAVVALYRTTTKGLHDDLRLAFGEQAVRRESLDDGRQVPIGPVPIGPVPIGPVPIGPVPIGPVPIGPVLNRPVPPRPRRPPLVVHSRAGTYPPLLQFLVTVAFLGFAAACVLAYATHSLLPFTVTSMVVAGLFVIVVLPVVVTAVWTPREFRRSAATSLLYLMLSRQRRPDEGAMTGPADLAVSTPAAEGDGELQEPEA